MATSTQLPSKTQVLTPYIINPIFLLPPVHLQSGLLLPASHQQSPRCAPSSSPYRPTALLLFFTLSTVNKAARWCSVQLSTYPLLLQARSTPTARFADDFFIIDPSIPSVSWRLPDVDNNHTGFIPCLLPLRLTELFRDSSLFF